MFARPKTITCPKCGKKIEYDELHEMNNVRPVARRRILDADLFTMRCPRCGQNTRNVYETSYHDLFYNMKIYVVLPENLEKARVEIRREEECFNRSAKDPSISKMRSRIVFDELALLEKVKILESELDDRVVEILKLLIFAQCRESNPEAELREVMFSCDHDGMVLLFFEDEGLIRRAQFPMELYEICRDAFAEKLVEDNEPLVDKAWAWKLVKT